MTQLSDEVVERVAKAICWAMAEDTDDCSSECMNAGRCMADEVDRSFLRDARAAIEAYQAYEAKGEAPPNVG